MLPLRLAAFLLYWLGGMLASLASITSADVDACVEDTLKSAAIEPAPLCSDEVFVRRVYLDVIGTLPSVEELTDFLEDQNPEKRTNLIDRLLERPEFNDMWALKWGDLLRIKSEFPINLWPNASQAYSKWVRDCVAKRVPLDDMARSLLVCNGSNFREAPVNFYRAVQKREALDLATAAVLLFVGERADRWQPDRLASLAPLFSQISYKSTAEWKEQIVFFDASKAPLGGVDAILPDGKSIHVPAGLDPRSAFADWLLNADNPVFPRVMANRLWSWIFGRGVVDPVDDLAAAQPSPIAGLSSLLGEALREQHYDQRGYFRVLLNTRCYQRAAIVGAKEHLGYFATYSIRRLDAELLIDAICRLTGTTEQYISAIPEPFTYSPRDFRSVALPDGSITSPFLELFGRPARDTGFESERNNCLSPLQSLHLLNSTHIREKLEKGARLYRPANGQSPRAVLRLLWMTALSRPPSEAEQLAMETYLREAGIPRGQMISEVLWCLINSNEFLYRH